MSVDSRVDELTVCDHKEQRSIMQPDGDPVTHGDERASRRAADAREGALPGGDVTVDEMSEASFPASDAPATWTWEVRATAADADGSDDS